VGDENVDHAVQMVEKGEDIKTKFAPPLLHGSVQLACIHDGSWIVETRAADHRTVHVSVSVISDEGNVEQKRAPLTSEQVENVVRSVDCVFGKNQRVQIVALVYGIFVIRLEFIEGDDMPYGEEDEKGGENKGDDIAKSRESERHLHRFYDCF